MRISIKKIFAVVVCIVALGGKSFSENAVSGHIFPELGFLNNPSSKLYYSVGVSLFSPDETLESIIDKASIMAAVYINLQKKTGVINRQAFIRMGNYFQSKAYQLVAPSSIEELENIIKNIEFKDGIVYGKFFIGLYQYPSSNEKKDPKAIFLYKRPQTIIDKSEINTPEWCQGTNRSIGMGESFTLDDAFNQAYESAILELSMKVHVEVTTQFTQTSNSEENLFLSRHLLSLSTIMMLTNIRIISINLYTLDDPFRYRYRVYLEIFYQPAMK